MSLLARFRRPMRVPDEPGRVHMPMRFYNMKGKFKTIKIHETTTALTVCKKLKKNKADEYSIVECLVSLNLERYLEDHEEIVPIYRAWGNNAETRNSFRYCKNPDKYLHFTNPLPIFPNYLSYIPCANKCHFNPPGLTVARFFDYHKTFHATDRAPVVHYKMQMCRNGEKNRWKNNSFLLRDGQLKMSDQPPATAPIDGTNMDFLLDVNLYNVYSENDTGIYPNTAFFFCLKETEEFKNARGACDEGLVHFCSNTSAGKQSMMTAMRAAKHGQILSRNFTAYKFRQGLEINNLPPYSMRTCIAMLCSTNLKKVPKQAQAHAQEAAGPSNRTEDEMMGLVANSETQTMWYNDNVYDRDRCDDRISEYSNMYDLRGVSTVRNPINDRNLFTVSFNDGENKIHHTRITKVKSDKKDAGAYRTCLQVVKSKLIFFDLLQLVEFCQLNEDLLGHTLDYFITKDDVLVTSAGEQVKLN